MTHVLNHVLPLWDRFGLSDSSDDNKELNSGFTSCKRKYEFQFTQVRLPFQSDYKNKEVL